MLKNILLSLIIVITLIISCDNFKLLSYEEWKEKSSYKSETEVYIGGYYYTTQYYPCYWKNGSRVDLKYEGDSEVNGISVYGDDVYCGGYYTSGTTKACYWKNSEVIKVESSGTSLIRSITVKNGVVYAAGEDNYSCYWINSKKYELKGSGTYAYSIFVDDDLNIYIGGTLGGKACYWVNNDNPVIIGSDTEQSLCLSIFVEDGVIYTAGSQNISSVGYPCYWINNKMKILEGSSYNYSIIVYKGNVHCAGNYSDAPIGGYWKNQEYVRILNADDRPNSITISNNNIYMAGRYYSSNYMPCYWKDFTLYALNVPSGSTASSDSFATYSIFVREVNK